MRWRAIPNAGLAPCARTDRRFHPGMTGILALWLPILAAAAFVFVVSSVLHMVVQWHKGDYRKLPDEDAVLDAMRRLGVSPGQFMFPCASSMKDFGSPEMQAKLARGPVGTLVVRGADGIQMGRALLQWFVFSLVLSACVAYVTGMCLPPGADTAKVFRLAGTVAVICYAPTDVTNAIWKGIRWSTTWRFVADGVLYGLATGAAFAWLWPAAA